MQDERKAPAGETLAEDGAAPDIEDAPPEGFDLSRTRGPYTTHNGPFYHKVTDQGFRHGVRLKHRHCNSRGIAHGGMLMAFADGLLATAVYRATKTPAVTVRVNSDFLSSAREGDWLEGTAEVSGTEDDVVFVRGHIEAGGREVLTASGVFKLVRR